MYNKTKKTPKPVYLTAEIDIERMKCMAKQNMQIGKRANKTIRISKFAMNKPTTKHIRVTIWTISKTIYNAMMMVSAEIKYT